jgi:hypothetical protein
VSAYPAGFDPAPHSGPNRLDRIRAVADAVLYEGYLLYPYRATSSKNQLRWQFGVLGPQGADAAGIGEDSHLSMQCLIDLGLIDLGLLDLGLLDIGRNESIESAQGSLIIHVRFLQLQRRRAERVDERGGYLPVPELRVDGERWFSWDEAVEVDSSRTVPLADLLPGHSWTVTAVAAESTEPVHDQLGNLAGRLVRQRWPVAAGVFARLEPIDGLHRFTMSIDNEATADGLTSQEEALRGSLLGTHVIIESRDPTAAFISVIDPPDHAREAAGQCRQHRCWPVLAGEPGAVSAVLGSPIILYDYPEIAGESTGSLFDATEIDEILMLRVLTMTDAEKAEARATDQKAAEIIERCDAMSPEDLMRLHGTFRDPDPLPPSWSDADDPFAVFNDHDPDTSEVVISGETVRKGSLVRLNPRRRADAQDLFYADQLARVTAIHRDLDDETHVAVVLVDDPAADLHDWYGRYLYFSPDEVVPVGVAATKEGESR